MSASMIRCACRSARSLVRLQKPLIGGFQSRSIVNDNFEEDLDDIDINHVNVKQPVYFPDHDKISSLQAKYPEVTISKEDFEYVRRILPATKVPELPENMEYPTPSGWVPPIASKQPGEYGITRTRNNMLPVYLIKHHSGRITTTVRRVHGDIHQLNTDIQNHLKKTLTTIDGGDVMVQIHEVGHFLRYKGNHVTSIGEFLLEKGF